jgi:ubiquinone/menaquinone biosynthesis C-methylase UbiE
MKIELLIIKTLLFATTSLIIIGFIIYQRLKRFAAFVRTIKDTQEEIKVKIEELKSDINVKIEEEFALQKDWLQSHTNFAVKRVEKIEVQESNSVDRYWGQHTVNSTPFKSAEESINYLEWRFEQYPLFREFMQLYGNHDDQVIVDYGCGPGNDLVGFLVYTRARKVIGIDVSEKALDLASCRLNLHQVDKDRVELLHTSDTITTIPLVDNTIDYIYCEGVLHHTSNPEAILKEFYRILKNDSYACIMVYNRASIWLHLYTAYIKMIVQNAFPGMDMDAAFSQNTDGENCPISRCYSSEEFLALCKSAGFEAEFVGGYLSLHELNCLQEFGEKALQDSRLADEHKEFIRNLEYDDRNYPIYKGKYAGIGGVYQLYKK